MKFRLGEPPETFEPDSNWRPIAEPSPLMLQVYCTPIAILSGGTIYWIWHHLLELEAPHIPRGWNTVWQIAIVASFPLLILVHELLHAVTYPHYGCDQATSIGCWPSRLLFYAHYDGELTRNRFLLVFANPFLIITLLPIFFEVLFPLPEIVASILAWFSIWNALFACGDLLGFAFILSQVPARALVRNKGWRSYWKAIPDKKLGTENEDD